MSRRRNLVLVVLAILALLTWYVVYMQQVVKELRRAADIQAAMYVVISKAAQDPDASDPVALTLELQALMRSSGVPFVLTNTTGTVTATENVPADVVKPETNEERALLDSLKGLDSLNLLDSLNKEKNAGKRKVFETELDSLRSIRDRENAVRLVPYVRELDARHPPIAQVVQRVVTGANPATLDSFPVDSTLLQPIVSSIHYGDLPLVRGLTVIPMLQAGAIVLLLAFGLYALKERGRADREKVWAGMAREAAHQLGTPLSSLGGWIELLDGRDGDATTTRAVAAMQQDLVRLERVSHRFERIGRPPRKDSVDAAALVERLAAYFAARAPTLGKQVEIVSERPAQPVMIAGDGVLLEWVLEVLIKNAIDALGGRSGKVTVSAAPLPEGGARVRVADDGPGVPRELRKRIFDAGFSTKQAGWGIGLSLARRIVEENHGGKLVLADSDHGAVFDVILNG